jgi:hypothetical protein
MKVTQAIEFHLQYRQANPKKNTVKTCEFVLSRFVAQFGKRDLAIISTEALPRCCRLLSAISSIASASIR